MPDRATVRRARQDARQGKSGLSKARRAGVKLPVPAKGTASAETRRKAARTRARS